VKIDFKHHIISDLAEFNPEKIILFGSYAGDNWDEESDIDIIVDSGLSDREKVYGQA